MRNSLLQLSCAAALTLATSAAAQSPQGPAAADSAARGRVLRPVTVTATRSKRDVHDVATPVSVLDSTTMRDRQPATAADLLRELPGVDVVGVGANQARPSIRGQRGQRILLLEDGLRLNNPRRQQDFGELPALVDVSALERVEVVRGPASVLYGTDAIGGAINLITRSPSFSGDGTLRGRVGYRFGTAGDAGKTELVLGGHRGAWAADFGASARVAGNYDAPNGSFGDVHLAQSTPVRDGGVRDRNLRGALAWSGDNGRSAFVRAEQYVADNAGFGFIPPETLGGDPTKIQILYPHQNYRKVSAGFASGSIGLPVADKVDVTAFASRNERDLAQNIFAFFGPGTPPGAGIDIKAQNYTDVGTVGARAEATKALSRAVVTWGVDAYRDNAAGRDSSLSTVIGFGPPSVTASTRPQIPNAMLTSVGGFAQGEFLIHDRVTMVAGGRLQHVSSEAQATAGRTDSLSSHANTTGVYAVNAIVRATSALSFVASVGRGFRSPNLVERYFDGPTPEGSAYQQAAPDLKPESSVNTDLGVKFRAGRMAAEAFVFENNISDAIQTTATGAKQGRLPVYANVNIGKLRARGAELNADVLLDGGFGIGGNWSTLSSKNVLQPAIPIGDSYSNKLNLALSWRSATGGFWGEYLVRHNSEQREIQVGTSPVGSVLPAFTVHGLRAGIRGWSIGSTRQDIMLGINNLFNTLYAEAANSGFFRPEPGRNITLGFMTSF